MLYSGPSQEQGLEGTVITIPTTLILGAGASMPYGFPSGKELVEEIIETSQSNPQQLADDMDCDLDYLEGFTKNLANSHNGSIDLFLSRNQDYTTIGKKLIAKALIPYEDPDTFDRRTTPAPIDDWYPYLLDKMFGDKLEDFKNSNKLSIITYNYDRSLEYFLHSAIKSSFTQATEREVAEVIKNLDIVHMHGSLGRLPNLESDRNICRNYHPEACRARDLEVCKKEVKIVSEIDRVPQTDPSLAPFFRARKLINESQKVCFLGFGYDTTNLGRLEITPVKNKFWGTSFEKGLDEMKTITDSIKYIKIENKKIVPFLKDHPILG